MPILKLVTYPDVHKKVINKQYVAIIKPFLAKFVLVYTIFRKTVTRCRYTAVAIDELTGFHQLRWVDAVPCFLVHSPFLAWGFLRNFYPGSLS